MTSSNNSEKNCEKSFSEEQLGIKQRSTHNDSKRKAKIIILDDDESILKLIKKMLNDRYQLDLFSSSSETLDKLVDEDYEVFILDSNLPGISGMNILKYCKNNKVHSEVVMISGHPDLNDAVSNVKDGAFDYLAKPFTREQLIDVIDAAVKKYYDSVEDKLSVTTPMPINSESNPLPGYKVIKTIGAGSMGVVLLVENNKQKYALKILRSNSDEKKHANLIKRFLREAKILSEITHPNIVEIYDSGFPENNVVPYILMEYIDGMPLSHYIYREKISLNKKLDIIRSIARALANVHLKGILHRDIKPENILLDQNMVPKITDFGIAKIADSSALMNYDCIGSPYYMPPEAFSTHIPLSERSDIFSLGILSYELITEEKPFIADNIEKLSEVIKNDRPERPSSKIKGLPLTVEILLEKMLHKNPDNRYSDCFKVSEAVNRLLDKKLKEPTATKRLLRSMIDHEKVWK